MYLLTHTQQNHTPWNKGKLIGQKPPLKLKEIWAMLISVKVLPISALKIARCKMLSLNKSASYDF